MTALAWAAVASLPLAWALLEVWAWIDRGTPGGGR